jgi:hypothetical protein
VARLDPRAEARFFAATAEAARFFLGDSDLHRALDALIRVLDDDGIPYAIIEALALGEYGYRRTAEDIAVLLTREGLEAFKRKHLGRGYVEKFAGSRGLRDARHGIPIDVVLAGDYPGDGKPKPVRFPDPGEIAQRGDRVALLPLETLIELKLASGMTAAHRLRDLADVLELIRACALPDTTAEALHPYVRDRFRELWRAAQGVDEPA